MMKGHYHLGEVVYMQNVISWNTMRRVHPIPLQTITGTYQYTLRVIKVSTVISYSILFGILNMPSAQTEHTCIE